MEEPPSPSFVLCGVGEASSCQRSAPWRRRSGWRSPPFLLQLPLEILVEMAQLPLLALLDR